MNINNAHEAIQVLDSDLKESKFSNASLAGASFDDVNLGRALFHNVNLANATFVNINLSNVRISDANTAGMTINGVALRQLLQSACAPGSRFTSVMPVLRVLDMQRAIDWYTQVLGFALQWRDANDGGGENCMLVDGTITLMLSTGTHLGGKPAFTGTLYFNTPEVGAFYERISGRVDVAWPLQKMDYGTTEFGIRDPDGYVLAFSERRQT